MHWKLQCRNKEQDKKILRLKLYGKIRNARLKLEPNVLIKKRLRSQTQLTFFAKHHFDVWNLPPDPEQQK